MSESPEKLERLMSRYLDDECTRDERRDLKAGLRSDPSARALFEEISALDREVGYALRRALGRPLAARRTLPLWSKVGRVVAVAVAASLVLMFWLTPPRRPGAHNRQDQPQRAGSWFAPPPRVGDTFRAGAADYASNSRKHDSQREWIVIPGEKPDEFFVVEIDRVRTRVIRVRRDL